MKEQNNVFTLDEAFNVGQEATDFVDKAPYKLHIGGTEENPEYAVFENPFASKRGNELIGVIDFLQFIVTRGSEYNRLKLANARQETLDKAFNDFNAAILQKYAFSDIVNIIVSWCGEEAYEKIAAHGISMGDHYQLIASVADYYADGLAAVGDPKK